MLEIDRNYLKLESDLAFEFKNLSFKYNEGAWQHNIRPQHYLPTTAPASPAITNDVSLKSSFFLTL